MTRLWARVAASAAVAAVVTAGSSSASAQDETDHETDHLDLVRQTTFVGDDPALIEVRVEPGDDDDRLNVQIFAPRTTREAVRASYEGEINDAVLSTFDATPSRGWRPNQIVRIRPDDDEVGQLLRRDNGALPVVIELVSDTGVVRDRLVTHLLVVDTVGPRLSLGFVADLRVGLARRADQTSVVDGPAIAEHAESLASHEVPFTVALHGETLEALDATGDIATLERLGLALSQRPIARTPWVELDEEGWRAAGESERVTEHFARGAAAIETHLGVSPGTIVELDPDANARTLGLLRTVGATGALVDLSHLSSFTRQAARSRPVQVLDANGLAMTVLAFDNELAETLRHDDPELAGQRALAELAMIATSEELASAVVVRLDGISPATLSVVKEAFAERNWLVLRDVSRLFEVDAARTSTGTLFRGTLRPAPAPALGPRAADLQLTNAMVDAYATMVAPAEAPIAPLRTQLLAAAAAELDDSASREYTAAVFDAVLSGTAGISIVPGERITLTDRRADLPLTLRNEQPLPITIELTLSAEKLRFPDGDRFIAVLQPGDNERTIRVETLASGDARITATLTSPDRRLELGSGAVDIRSTAISGLGLVISAVALLVLGGWWGRTILRVRRDRAAATVARAPQTRTGPSEGEP